VRCRRTRLARPEVLGADFQTNPCPSRLAVILDGDISARSTVAGSNGRSGLKLPVRSTAGEMSAYGATSLESRAGRFEKGWR